MLAIRMQRTGRKGHAMFRLIVQDARRTPTSGKVVARLGSFDPHAKTVSIDKEKAAFYLEHGAQPSDRVARLLKDEGVKLPDWVKSVTSKERSVRNPEKRRSTKPDEPEAPAEEPKATETEAPAEETTAPEAEAPSEETAEEKPAEEAEKTESEAEPEAEEKAEIPTEEAKPAESDKPADEEPAKD